MIPTKLFAEFFESEKAAGLILIGCTAISLMLTNSAFGSSYQHLWHTGLLTKPLEFWINDGLMAIFFLLVGLEIEREVYVGEFSNFKKALLPIFAAIGGMLVPAAIHLGFNHGSEYQSGFGIPMATDIAFSLGILSLLGKRVPLMLKVFLTALAIMDDLGAILIIAIFYSGGIQWMYLGAALLLFALLLFFNRKKVNQLWPYLGVGIIIWFCLYQSGIHPTITGILVAFAIPFRDGGESSPSYRLQHALHKIVAFVVLPLFALANTAILIPQNVFGEMFTSNNLGIMLGLVIGKPIGIVLFSLLGIALGWSFLPEGVRKSHIMGVGLLAGIGFTMSIFITLLALTDAESIISAKMAILFASFLAGLLGFLWLYFTLPKDEKA